MVSEDCTADKLMESTYGVLNLVLQHRSKFTLFS